MEDIVAFCDQASDQALSILNAFVHEKVAAILKIVKEPTKREEILEAIGLTNHTTNRKKYLDPLLDYGWVKMQYPGNPTTPNQRYLITEKGKHLLRLLKEKL